jgi:hypothetical protein
MAKTTAQPCCWSATANKWKVHDEKIAVISFVA